MRNGNSLVPAVLASSFLALSGCVPNSDTNVESEFRESDLGNCGHSSIAGFGSRTDYPAIDEGEGFVSFLSYARTETHGSWQAATLIQCRAAKGLGVTLFEDQENSREPNSQSVRTLLPRLSGRLTFDKVTAAASSQGYKTDPYRAVRGESERSVCACELYYPGSTANWPAASAVN